jgi:HSP20 family molecular chaperone IbpA
MNDQTIAAPPAVAEAVNDAPTFVPPADIIETKDAIIMLLEMAGADPGSLSVTVEKNVLTVSARSTPFSPQGYTLAYAEYRDGNYERAFSLPQAVDIDRAEATFKDGVLRLMLPKVSPSPAKKITVKSA